MEHTFNKVIDLLYLAKQDGVEVVLNEDRLQFKIAENRDIDENLLKEIRNNKQSIIDYLTSDNWKATSNGNGYNKIGQFNRAQVTQVPLSFSQERLWFIDQLEGSIQYHSPSVLRLKGDLNSGALSHALKMVINRHDILRSVFQEDGGQVYQSVKEKDDWQIQIIECSKLNEDADALKLYIESLIKTPFNLSTDYPVRATLMRLSAEEHILVVTLHHIASDAWSVSIIVNEVVELYNAFIEDRQAVLPPLTLQYADYAVWQRNYLQGEILSKKISYWKQKLGGLSTLQLPTDYSRPSVRGTKGANAFFRIDKELLVKLQELSRQQDASLFMVLLSVFKVLLYRYSGQLDITVGTSIASRQQKELEGLIGFFVNTLALRDEINTEASFTELLQQVKTTTLEAYQHQELPFEKVVETVVTERDLGISPLFQVMLVLQNTPESSRLRLGDVEISGEPVATNISKFDITFFIAENPNGLQGVVEYSTDLYNAATIQQMTAHFATLLSSVVKFPRQKIGLLPMIDKVERQQLLQQFNGSKIDYPTDKSITELFEEQVANTPGNTAVVFESEQITFLQLNERSNQLAHYLQSRGVQAGALVPLYMNRSPEIIVAILGIMKAGAAYVPIDTDFPQDRSNYMLADTGAKIIVSNNNNAGKLALQPGVEIIETNNISNQPKENLPTKPLSNQLAYVIYTSGSTGKPKGVMIEHRSLADYYFGLDKHTQISQCGSFALVSTIATDLGNTVIYSSLLSGGALHIFSKESVSNIEYLHQYFNEHPIDCLKIVPSHWKALSSGMDLLLPQKLLIFGGETLYTILAEEILLSGSHCRVVNHYGPTETTIGKLLHEVKQGNDYNKTIPIGKPFSNSSVYILSKEMQPSPVGIPGQLYITGDGLARGYFNNEALTTEKFVADTISNVEGQKMYGTGDLVKWLPDGKIEFIGRVDDQVKIRGYRIEPGEIETVLQQSTFISQAVVLAKDDKQGGKRLVAYIVPKEEFYREGILEYLKEKLPEYMIPAVLMEMESLPLTPNGKTDRKALPDPDAADLTGDHYVAPRNDTEAKLAAIWQDVLEVEQVGIHDDFFELGGHSLLAVRLISAIRKAFVVEMPIGEIFDHPTVALLAAQLASQSGATVLPAIEKADPRPQFIPLSFSQERLWFIDRLGGSLPYHVPAVLRLKGMLNEAALSNALQQIINRHEVLRTVIREEQGTGYQFIKNENSWKLQTVDGAIYRQDMVALQQYIEQCIDHPFNLAEDDMLRATLVHLDKDDNILVVTLHHIASDGWSTSIIVKELVELYNAGTENRDASLNPLPIQYADYAIWQRKYLQGDVLETKLAYWKNKLEGAEVLELSTDFPRPPVQSNDGDIIGFGIDKALSDQLNELCQQQGVTLFMALLAVIKILLYRYSGQQDICVGTPVAGRQQQEVEGLIGFFINTLDLRSQVNGTGTFKELLGQVRATTLEAYSHQEVPFEKVVESVIKERDMSRSPLFQVMLVLQNTPVIGELRLGDVQLSRGIGEASSKNTTKFDLTFNITETVQGIRISLEYCTALYKEDTIKRMAEHFTSLLKEVVKNPEQTIGLLPMLSPAEEQQLTFEFNDRKEDYPGDKTIIDLFEAQVADHPENTALVFEGEQLTYLQLDERSNQLARYLQMKGVTSGMMVPLCLERGTTMMVAILGILKAGGAYVPIDPGYPQERIAFMLEDVSAQVVLSSKESRRKLPVNIIIDIIETDSDWPLISKQPFDNIQSSVGSDSVANIIYTSGSTGKPKGVMVTHANVVSLVKGVDYTRFSDNDILLSTGSFSFDATTFEYWGMLLNGGQLVLCTENKLLDNTFLKEEINTRGANKMWFTSSWFNQLVEADITLFANLETILVGGEKLSAYHIEKLRQRYPQIEIINGYGPTENTTFSLTYRVNEKEINEPIPIGRPLSNRIALILDENLQLVPVGVSGEICLGGAGLSAGYLNQPQLTAEKFIPNPFMRSSGEMIYRTGDIGRWLPDGNIEFMGRRDEQVKIRGYRVELGEIENVLQQSALVAQSVVLVKEDSIGNKSLTGYIVPVQENNKEAIITYLRGRLPEYMVPSAWVQLSHLPLTANGKIDKRALAYGDSPGLFAHQYDHPRNGLETQMAGIWQELLGMDNVGINDDFFEMGGHSLLAIRLISAIRKTFAVEMPIGDIFDYPTVALLTAQLANQSGTIVLPAIEKAGTRPAHIPLSFSQERLWFIDQSGGSLQYHVPAVLRLKGNLDIEALSNALQQIINRHEVLRTVILEEEGSGYQFIKDKDAWQLQLVDGSIYKEDMEGLQNYILQCIEAPFNLAKDYMIRASLVSLEAGDQVLIVTLHHIASDGWSASIIVRELVELYNAGLEKRLPSLPPVPIQYADYALWQRKYLQGEILEKKLQYWKDKLEGVTALQLSTDYSRPSIQTTNGGIIGLKLDKGLSKQLEALGQQQGTTLFMTLLATLKVLLYRYTGQQDICVGTPVAGRQQQEVEGLIGFFINTLALRSALEGNVSFKDFLQQVRTTTLQAYAHQEVPFEKVVDAVVKERAMDRSPLFQVALVLQNTPEIQDLRLGDVQLSNGFTGLSAHTTSKFELTFSITETLSGLHLSVEYSADLYTEQTIKRMMGHFNALLHSVVNAPGQSIGLLPMLTGVEEKQLLVDFNNTASVFAVTKTVACLFEEQVAKKPGATALVFGGQTLTYQQLDGRANQLANYLIDKGIKPGENVGLLSSRRLEMIIGIFGIIKAGGVYVPFNTEYPAERLQYIVEDAGIKYIVYTDVDLLAPNGLNNYECINLNDAASYPTKTTHINTGLDSPVYIMYTSGTTGRPKGILVSNRNILKLVFEPADIAVRQEDRMLQWSNFAFDGSVYEIFSSLLSGAGLYLIKDGWASDVYELGRVMKEQKITVCFLTTALFNTFIDIEPGMLTGLRKILFGGEMVSASHVRKALQVIGPAKIVHVYGPTETTVFATYCPVDIIREENIIPIGRPLSNTTLRVLDNGRQLVPIGVPGELYIGGDGVSLGYLNNDLLTLEKFVYLDEGNSGERFYRSGDMVRWLPDGNIDYIGRIDNQLKIRGYRIEPGEIENVLQESDMVSKAVVMVKEDKEKNKELVGYIVPTELYNKTVLVSWLQKKLPAYMIPALWVEMDSFTLNQNGKIDKNALPDADDIDRAPANLYEAPRNELEARMAAIFEEVLEIETVGIHDNFFERGGHSLDAIRLVSIVRKKMEVDISINDIFIYPTIAGLIGNFIEKIKNPSLPAANIKYLVPIKTLGNKVPLYIIAGGGGTALRFKEFSGLLDPAQPVYVLQPPIDSKDLKEFPGDIEGIAQKFAEEILIQNPDGPFALAGHCLGGIIAFEIAKQLEASGKKVHLLAMFDTIIREKPIHEPGTIKNLFHIPATIRRSVYRLLLKVDFETFLLTKHTRQSIRYKMKTFRSFIKRLQGEKILDHELEFVGLEIFNGSADIYVGACANYKLSPYNGEIVLFYAKEHYFFLDREKHVSFKKWYLDENTKTRWRKYATNIIIHEIEGEHSEIFDPVHGDEFADVLQRHLNNYVKEDVIK